VHTANGSGMKISHVGHSIVQSTTYDLHLNNISHVPSASKNLVSVHQLTRDNNAFVEFHLDEFFIKEAGTKRMLLRGRCNGCLYALRPSSASSTLNKHVFGAAKPSASLWHSRLGHAFSSVVQEILNRFKLSCVKDLNNKHVCDACQQGKSHQLPYPTSTSVSNEPLNLVFSDVWGPAPTSVGRFNYYLSFIDDYSKFTWI
jgi:hypothetical protein